MADETDTKSERQFSAGDVVQLKSGGPAMTFNSYMPDGQAHVQYMTGAGVQHSVMPAAMLRFARAETPAARRTDALH